MIIQNIVIAGAGIIGNSVAYYLSKNYVVNNEQKLSITLIDPVGICPAASAKAGGFLAKEWRNDMIEQELHQLGFDLHEELGNDLEGTDYRRLTCVNAAVDGNLLSSRKHNSKKMESLSSSDGDSLSSLESSEMEWVDDSVVLATMDLGTEENIAQVHPKKLCDKMWEYSSSEGGVKLKIGRVVQVILQDNDGNDKEEATTKDKEPKLHSVKLDDGSIINADVLIVATGPWTEEIRSWFPNTEQMQTSLASLPSITGVKSHSMLVKTDQILKQAVFFQSDDSINDIEVYPRPDGDSYITGSSHPKSIMTERPGEETVEPQLKEELLDAMRRTSPEILGNVEPHTTQACFWPETNDGLPVIGPLPNLASVIVATGHSVWGILQGPATGLAIAELLMEGKARSVDLKPFGMGSKRKSPLMNYMDFGPDVYVDSDGLVW